MKNLTALFAFGLLIAAGNLSAADPATTPEQRRQRQEFFELKVRPLLVEKCASCHSGEADAESVLPVDSRQALLKGGDFGPAIAPGRSADSLLIEAAKRTHKELQMPPDDDDALSRGEIATLVRWIDEGAVWGKETKPANSAVAHSPTDHTLDTDHWSFQPRQVMPPPAVADPRWSQSEIDRFVEAQRQAAGVAAGAAADRRTLLRRATFDLTGLPPTAAEVADFLNDADDDETALARVVDRLLASPHYGERQGRQWLDVARYADTQGDVGDFPIPAAYLYRNWVIDAINDDLPFDDFLRAQIAGDILAHEEDDPEAARKLVVATGFIALARRFGNTKKNDMHLTIEDTLDTLGRGVLGLTLRCARCHNHKFDPLPNTDYYRLYGIFESTVYPWMGASDEKSPSNLSPPTSDAESRAKADAYWALISRYEYQINNHHRPWLKPTLDAYREVTEQLKEAAGEKAVALKKERDELLSRYSGKFRELMLHDLNWIKKEKQQLAESPPVQFLFAVSEGKPHNARLHRRGNPKSLGDEVPRGFLQILAPEPAEIETGSGRLELARWITRAEHPLTARVVVNRIWQQHFGRGIVETTDNFGRQGALPSHPEMLDWLAEQFVRDGWSLKKLHRRIMLSETYRLASGATEPAQPQLLSQFSRRRLDAEEIRDAMLAVSGQLDRSPGKAHPFKPWYATRYSLNRPFQAEFPTRRRSVYMMTQRLFRNSFLGLFDGPDRNSSTANRNRANVPSQALYLMNSSFVKEQSAALAQRIEAAGGSNREQVARLYERALARPLQDDEWMAIEKFLADYRITADEKKQAESSLPLVALCRAVLTSNEFFFVD